MKKLDDENMAIANECTFKPKINEFKGFPKQAAAQAQRSRQRLQAWRTLVAFKAEEPARNHLESGRGDRPVTPRIAGRPQPSPVKVQLHKESIQKHIQRQNAQRERRLKDEYDQ